MTGPCRNRGHSRRRRPAERPRREPESWLPSALTNASSTHEPDTARIRERIDGPTTPARMSDSRRPGAHGRPRNPNPLVSTGRSRPSQERSSRLRHRPTVLAFGAATGAVCVAAVTVVGFWMVSPDADNRPITVAAAPLPSTSTLSSSPTPTSMPTPSTSPSPTGWSGPTDPASAASGPATTATPGTRTQTPTTGQWQLRLSMSAIPAGRVVLPQQATRDWVLYGRGTDGTLPEQARANTRSTYIGQLDVTGGNPTVVTGMNGRFDWNGGRPQATGKDYIERIAVQTPGELRLTIPPTGISGHLDLYLGTLGVRGQVRVDVGGKTAAAMTLQPPQPGRWVDAVVRISFQGTLNQGSLTIRMSTSDGAGQPGSNGQQGGAGSSGQLSLAAAVLSDGF